ncbi:hypothetical protein [Xenorhabdus sp. KJ12.1]|uniref:hypothetical protein n=1 Tax=Xenorhabdus sp. KJ12.1 TaxID=1851571 RepID=UPI000C03E97B|nr:hypothetical protein [Xenorhabdus sp. KJ12.1]PHM72163.1 hypothetical protein Xekj_00441 [Xenorhabdus sp. KJ12.1]
MSEDNVKSFNQLASEEKEARFSSLSKVAIKSIHSYFNLDATEKELKNNVAETSEKVNSLSKKLASGEEHNREIYNNAVKELTKANRKFDKFLDNYEELRDGTGDKLKELRSFLDELIAEISDDQTI